MSDQTVGIHHVTAIASSPERNVAFYTGTLGLRLVKRTVNFDDPYTYHLYYGDRLGTPGTILTFFPYLEARSGRVGRGQAAATAFSIPEASVGFWRNRLGDAGIETTRSERFGAEVIAFADHDGQPLELLVHDGDADPWQDGPVPTRHALRGFHGVTLRSADPVASAGVLKTLGFERAGEEGDRERFLAGGDRAAAVDLLSSEAPPGWLGAGTVHHVAFRVEDEDAQDRARERLIEVGLNVTGVKDRQYFQSIYFREPGGVLFELATDGPGFDRDEAVSELGTGLKLPPWLEEDRGTIEGQLPALPAPGETDPPSSP